MAIYKVEIVSVAGERTLEWYYTKGTATKAVDRHNANADIQSCTLIDLPVPKSKLDLIYFLEDHTSKTFKN